MELIGHVADALAAAPTDLRHLRINSLAVGYSGFMDMEEIETVQRFAFAWEPRYRLPALAFGVTPRTAWVEVTSSEVYVRYGLWKLRTTLSNISGVEVSGPYGFLKTAGPAHLSMNDRGITFATNSREGLCITFGAPVPGIDPTKRIKHPGATLTVADIAGLARALGFPGSVTPS